jgi:hypothetical protein
MNTHRHPIEPELWQLRSDIITGVYSCLFLVDSFNEKKLIPFENERESAEN